nr:Uncharacterised protein [Klebsiella pneumoniae]
MANQLRANLQMVRGVRRRRLQSLQGKPLLLRNIQQQLTYGIFMFAQTGDA